MCYGDSPSCGVTSMVVCFTWLEADTFLITVPPLQMLVLAAVGRTGIV